MAKGVLGLGGWLLPTHTRSGEPTQPTTLQAYAKSVYHDPADHQARYQIYRARYPDIVRRAKHNEFTARMEGRSELPATTPQQRITMRALHSQECDGDPMAGLSQYAKGDGPKLSDFISP